MSEGSVTPSSRRAGSKVPLLAGLVFSFAIVFSLIGLIEVLFIGADVMSGGTVASRVTPDLELGVRSWTVHHAMRPGYSSPAVRTNSFGLRSPEVAVPKPDGTYRILLLGDSFTFGFKASDETVFARVLESRLRRGGFPNVEVVNAGVLSYCPLVEYLQYKHHLHALEPDLVILNFDMSDVQDHLEYSRAGAFDESGEALFVTEPTLGTSPARLPGLLSFKWLARYVRSATRRVEAGVEGVPFTRDVDRYLWALDHGQPMEKEVDATLKPIASLARLLGHHGVGFGLATYPQPWQVSPRATPRPPIREQYGIGYDTVHLNDRPFRRLATFARGLDVPFLDATPAYRAASDPVGLYMSNDFHFTPRGNEFYATQLERFITEQWLKTASVTP
jgi:hypothetical protein